MNFNAAVWPIWGKQGEVGLDLDVYSFVTDRVRDVKTLSGGESFLAALAMALGMADVIQNAAGSVKVDAMFIDEGFGSLDEESRTRAVQGAAGAVRRKTPDRHHFPRDGAERGDGTQAGGKKEMVEARCIGR